MARREHEILFDLRLAGPMQAWGQPTFEGTRLPEDFRPEAGY